MKKQKKENGSGTFRIVNGKYNYRFFYIDEFGEKKRKSFCCLCLQLGEFLFDPFRIVNEHS